MSEIEELKRRLAEVEHSRELWYSQSQSNEKERDDALAELQRIKSSRDRQLQQNKVLSEAVYKYHKKYNELTTTPRKLKCIFCDFEGESLFDLEEHSAKCEKHPLWTARPEGMPSVEELAEVLHKAEPHMPPATYRERNEAMATAVLAALRPWLREPTGWELDVEPEVTYEAGSSGIYFAEQCDIDWLYSRIRPTFDPCKRCAKLSSLPRLISYDNDELGRMVRHAWVEWAKEQPNPKPSWLLPYEELSEADKDADRRIGEHLLLEVQKRLALVPEGSTAVFESVRPAPETPNGLPSAEELVKSLYPVIEENSDGFMRDGLSPSWYAWVELLVTETLTALRPWLREPTGWELDVTADELADALLLVADRDVTVRQAAKQLLDLCRSRIRPTFDPCKRCAKLSEYRKIVLDGAEEVRNRIDAARATLEGE